jgi:hypothetical protein
MEICSTMVVGKIPDICHYRYQFEIAITSTNADANIRDT